MKIALINLNGMQLNGETTYTYELARALRKQPDLEVSIFELSKRGKQASGYYYTDGIECLSTKNIDRTTYILNQFDILHFINCGNYFEREEDIPFYKDVLAGLTKPIVFTISSVTAHKDFCHSALVYNHPMAKGYIAVRPSIHSFCKTYYPKTLADKQINLPIHFIEDAPLEKEAKVVSTSRIEFAKKQDKMLNALGEINCKFEIWGEPVSRFGWLLKQMPEYNPLIFKGSFNMDDREKIYSTAKGLINLTTTNSKYERNPVEDRGADYVILEGMSYGCIPIVLASESSGEYYDVKVSSYKAYDEISYSINRVANMQDKEYMEAITKNYIYLFDNHSQSKIGKEYKEFYDYIRRN